MTMIDRSNNNGTDNFVTAHKAGVTHAYFKATDGAVGSDGKMFVDSTYHERFAAADAAGVVPGAYHFAEHGNPTVEADHFLSVIGTPKAGRLRPCLDLESGEDAAWAAAFVEHLHAKLGYWPVLYGNTSTIPALRSASASVRACPWWAANYGVNDGQRHPLPAGIAPAAHQYTSVARFPGISGDTDASVFLDETVMLVPAAKPAGPTRPDHYRVEYTTKAGKRETRETRHPVLWQHAHRHANWRGDLVIHPVHKP